MARPHGDFPTTPKLVLTVPQTPLSATQGVFLSLILCGIFHSHKHGKKLNPTNLSKSFSSIPQEESVTCQKKVCHSVEIIVSLGKPELGGGKVFLFRLVCHGVARLQLTFPFAQQSGFSCVDTISEIPYVNCSEQFPLSTVQSRCKICAG